MSTATLPAYTFAELETVRNRRASLAEQLSRLWGSNHNQALISEVWARLRDAEHKLITVVEGLCDDFIQQDKNGEEVDEGLRKLFDIVCDWLKRKDAWVEVERLVEVVRTILVTRPDLVSEVPADVRPVVFTLRVRPQAYLRAMANLFWSAIRHPLSETTIDLTTGRVLYRT